MIKNQIFQDNCFKCIRHFKFRSNYIVIFHNLTIRNATVNQLLQQNSQVESLQSKYALFFQNINNPGLQKKNYSDLFYLSLILLYNANCPFLQIY
ncbi:hypothetical protein pb186bvf_001866 [Paramecium bursaria]